MDYVAPAVVDRSDALGLYVHVPFCERICPYCDFAVERAPRLAPALERAYLEGLEREWALLCERFGDALGRRPRATLYLGGGTPGMLAPDSVERIVRGLGAAGGGPSVEITLEVNPSRAEREPMAGFRAAGVTRVSLGVQSLRDGTLRRLGRGHAGRDARRGLERALAAGFDSLSVDLIYGVPEQGEAELLEDLGELIALGVPHVSAYALTLEPGTPFARAHAGGNLRLPPEEDVRRMSRRLRAELAAAGYAQYEISSFARPGHASRHNQRYWLREDVVGLGVGAASLLGDRRFANCRERGEWAAALGRGALPWAESECLPPLEARREALALGLRRLEGVSRAQYGRRYGARPEDDFAAELRELRELELICEQGGAIRLSERGILFADEVFLRLVRG